MADMPEKPNFVPTHKLPTWLSSEDVLQTVRDLADQGADKAFCWDMTQAVYQLIERTNSGSGIPVHPTAKGVTLRKCSICLQAYDASNAQERAYHEQPQHIPTQPPV